MRAVEMLLAEGSEPDTRSAFDKAQENPIQMNIVLSGARFALSTCALDLPGCSARPLVRSSHYRAISLVLCKFLLAVTISVPLLARPSLQPQFQWAKRVASTINEDDEIDFGMSLDNQGNVYVTGWFDGANDFGGVTLSNSSGGGQDIFVAKYDSTGTLQWARRAGGSTTHQDTGRGIGVDNAGNVYVTGGVSGSADFGTLNLQADGNQFFLAKYDKAGTAQWARVSAGAAEVYGLGLAVDAAGNSYALGFADNVGSITFGTTNLLSPSVTGYSTFLIKYDTSGALQWAQMIGGPGQTYATKLALDAGGNVYVTGGFSQNITIGAKNLLSTGAGNSFTAKFDSAGALIWARQAGGAGAADSGEGGDDGAVAVDQAGNVYISGRFSGDSINFGGGISLTNAGGWDAFLARYNSAGEPQWARRAGGTGFDIFFDVALDSQGNVYASGELSSDALAPNGSGAAMLAKYDPAGTLRWVVSGSGPQASPVGSVALKVAVDPSGNCYLAGAYQGSLTLGKSVLQAQGYWNFFLAKVAADSGPWQPGPPLLTARDQFAGAVLNGKIIVFGGNGNPNGVNLKSTELLDPTLPAWVYQADNDHNGGGGVEELSGAVVNAKLYVYGGGNGDVNFVEEYDPSNNTWTSKAPMPTTRSAATAFAYNNKIYVFGGNNVVDGIRTDYDVIEAYDPATNTWITETHFPQAAGILGRPAIAVVGDKVYVIGGFTESGGNVTLLSAVAVYNFLTRTWSTDGYAPFPNPRAAFPYSGAAPTKDGKIYLVGGIGATSRTNSWPSSRVDIYDTVSNTWTTGEPLPMPYGNGQFSAILGNDLWVVGADSPDLANTTIAAVWKYNLANNATHSFTYETNNGAIIITEYTGSGMEVTIPDTVNGLPVTSIGKNAFANCITLASVTIPNTIPDIGSNAFFNCPSLTSVYFKGDAPAGSTDLSVFSGDPLARVYYSEGSAGWSASFDGVPTTGGGPRITVLSSGNDLTILWPDTATNFQLQAALNLSSPISWSNATGSFQTNGGSISIVLPMIGPQKFYRLLKP
jgi:N-acetylneuraminic acid mutarotase